MNLPPLPKGWPPNSRLPLQERRQAEGSKADFQPHGRMGGRLRILPVRRPKRGRALRLRDIRGRERLDADGGTKRRKSQSQALILSK